MLFEYVFGFPVERVQRLADLFVDLLGLLLAEILAGHEVAAEEDVVVVVAVRDGTQAIAHAVLADHLAREARRLLQVVRRAGRQMPEDDLLGGSPAHRVANHRKDLVAREVVAVLGRQRLRDAEGHPARDDRDLVHRIAALGEHRDERMAALVIRRDALVLVGHHETAALGAEQHLVLGALEVDHRDLRAVAARCEQRRFVDEVLQVGADEARRTTRRWTSRSTSSASGTRRVWIFRIS